MKENDFKRKDPSKQSLFKNPWAPKNIGRPSKSIETNDVESVQVETDGSSKKFLPYFGAISAAIGLIAVGFGMGAYWGIYKTEQQYPLKLEMAIESQRDGEIRNGELQAENNSLQKENDELKTSISELEKKVEVAEEEQVNLGTAISENLRLPVETMIEARTTKIFFDKLNISVVHIGNLPEGYGATLSVSSSGQETKTAKEIQVGEKIFYEVNNMRYEVLVTDIDIFTASIQVIELPLQ